MLRYIGISFLFVVILLLQDFAPAPHELLKKFNQNFYLPSARQKRMLLQMGVLGESFP